MRLAITSKGDTLDSEVFPSFGQSPYLLIVEIDENGNYNLLEVVENKALSGKGVSLAKTVLEKGVSVLISGNIGSKASTILKQGNVKVLNGSGLTVRKAIEEFLNRNLNEIQL